MLQKVYLVVQHYGYGRRAAYNTRNVIVYPDKEMAEKHAQESNQWLINNGWHYDVTDKWKGYKPDHNPWDPSWVSGGTYSGGEYVVEEIDYSIHIDEFRDVQGI